MGIFDSEKWFPLKGKKRKRKKVEQLQRSKNERLEVNDERLLTSESNTIWGQKTLQGESAMIKMNVRRLANYVYELVGDSLKGITKKNNLYNTEEAESNVSNVMDLLKDRNQVRQYSVDAQNRWISWSDIHGSKLKGTYAFLCDKIIRLFNLEYEASKFKWYHGLFLYKFVPITAEELLFQFTTEMNTPGSEFVPEEEVRESLGAEEVEDWLTERTNLESRFKFIRPYYAMDVDLTFQPMRAVEKIKLGVILDSKE